MKYILSLLILCFLSVPSFAQDALNSAQVKRDLAKQKTQIERTETQLTEETLKQNQILKIRDDLRSNRETLKEIAENVAPALEEIKANIEDLGPAPEGENPEPEPENIRKNRAALTDKSLATEGLIKEAEALSAKSTRLLEKVAAVRRGQFINQLFEPQISSFNLDLWQNAYDAFSDYSFTNIIPLKKKTIATKTGIILSILLFFVLFITSSFFSKRKFETTLRDVEKETPCLSAVARSLALPVLTMSIGLFILYQILSAQDLLTDTNQHLIQKGLLLFAFTAGLFLSASRLLKAKIIRPQLRCLIFLTAALYFIDALFLEIGHFKGTVLELTIAQSYMITTTFALILGGISIAVLRAPQKDKHYFIPHKLFALLLGSSCIMILGNLFGYVAFGRFVFERATLLFSLLAALALIRAFVRPYFTKFQSLFSKQGKAITKKSESLFIFWCSLFLDITLFLVSLPILASIFGAETSDIKDWISQAFFGFKVGSITISIANIGVAIILFLTLIFITRLIQRVLSVKILPRTKMDESIRHSIIQILGYIGLIIAFLSGISALGFNLTNLALIAGALSVGIGFGLQSIVSNFVSGLILLFERPIKVNDWIITNSGEGFVKKISVRATEIETFDKTSIIVPNSELISSSVKNWTHEDRIGRVTITIGVSYDSDPHHVRDILLKCADESGFSLKKPEPTIHFRDFGDNALIFDLRFFIKSISDIYTLSTQMRFNIWDALKDADIEISFPQRDLHIRSAPGLEKIFKGKKK